jgi:hypothetical protein
MMTPMNDALRAAIAADFAPVQPLPAPVRRAMPVVPLAALLLLAAPIAFDFRDLVTLGCTWSWGASALQTSAGLATIVLALRESVPGRGWPAPALAITVVGIVLLFVGVTLGSWNTSPVALSRGWWEIGGLCLVGSAGSALPVVALSAVLIVGAFPLKPAWTGALAGVGGGLIADAGWRLFCHFSDPAHVMASHLGAIALAAVAGSLLTSSLDRNWTAQRPG